MMAAKTETAAPWKNEGRICARCRCEDCSTLTRSPVEGVWTVYRCNKCFYTWRDAESEAFTNPDKYPEQFRIDPKNLDHLFVMPSIAPLRTK